MSVGMTVIGVIFFFIFLFVRLSERFVAVTPLVALLLSVFVSAFAHGPGLIAQVSAGLSTFAVALIVADVTIGFMGRSRITSIGQSHNTLALWIVPLVGILAVHNFRSAGNLFDESQRAVIVTANPWGLVILLALILFSQRHFAVLSEGNLARHAVFHVVTWTSIILGVVDLLVFGGLVYGNVAKVSEGIGGMGLANLSTNETAMFACGLLLWNLRFLMDGSVVRKFAFIGLMLNLIVIVLSKSRLGLGAAMILVSLYLFFSKSTRGFKLLILLPAVIVFGVIAAALIATRTAAEFTGGFSESLLGDIPGSGRPIIWFFYLDAFSYLAAGDLIVWIFGVGSMGLIDLYGFTPLEQLGLVTENVPFYPLHSDLVHILLASGAVGLILWFGTLWTLARMKWKRSDRFSAIGALLTIVFASSGDMLIYIPSVTLLVLYAFMSSLDISGAPEPAFVE